MCSPHLERTYLVAMATELTLCLESTQQIFFSISVLSMIRWLAKGNTYGLQDCTEVIFIAFITLHDGISSGQLKPLEG